MGIRIDFAPSSILAGNLAHRGGFLQGAARRRSELEALAEKERGRQFSQKQLSQKLEFQEREAKSRQNFQIEMAKLNQANALERERLRSQGFKENALAQIRLRDQLGGQRAEEAHERQIDLLDFKDELRGNERLARELREDDLRQARLGEAEKELRMRGAVQQEMADANREAELKKLEVRERQIMDAKQKGEIDGNKADLILDGIREQRFGLKPGALKEKERREKRMPQLSEPDENGLQFAGDSKTLADGRIIGLDKDLKRYVIEPKNQISQEKYMSIRNDVEESLRAQGVEPTPAIVREKTRQELADYRRDVLGIKTDRERFEDESTEAAKDFFASRQRIGGNVSENMVKGIGTTLKAGDFGGAADIAIVSQDPQVINDTLSQIKKLPVDQRSDKQSELAITRMMLALGKRPKSKSKKARRLVQQAKRTNTELARRAREMMGRAQQPGNAVSRTGEFALPFGTG